MEVGDYFKDIQPLYVMIAQVTKILGDRVYYKPLNFDDWDEELDWFHKDSIRGSRIKIIPEEDVELEIEKCEEVNIYDITRLGR